MVEYACHILFYSDDYAYEIGTQLNILVQLYKMLTHGNTYVGWGKKLLPPEQHCSRCS